MIRAILIRPEAERDAGPLETGIMREEKGLERTSGNVLCSPFSVPAFFFDKSTGFSEIGTLRHEIWLSSQVSLTTNRLGAIEFKPIQWMAGILPPEFLGGLHLWARQSLLNH